MRTQYFQNLITLDSCLITISKHQIEEMFVNIFEFVRQRHSPSLQHLQITLHIHAIIASFTNQHLIKHNTYSPYITLLGILVRFVCFRRHVFGRSDVIKHVGFVRHFFHLTVPEINNSYSLVLFGRGLEKDIIRLQVPMNNVLVFDAFVALQNLPQNDQNLVFRQSIWMLSDVICQSPSLQQLHH